MIRTPLRAGRSAEVIWLTERVQYSADGASTRDHPGIPLHSEYTAGPFEEWVYKIFRHSAYVIAYQGGKSLPFLITANPQEISQFHFYPMQDREISISQEIAAFNYAHDGLRQRIQNVLSAPQWAAIVKLEQCWHQGKWCEVILMQVYHTAFSFSQTYYMPYEYESCTRAIHLLGDPNYLGEQRNPYQLNFNSLKPM